MLSSAIHQPFTLFIFAGTATTRTQETRRVLDLTA